MLKPCERCGNEFDGRWNQKYCNDCRAEAYRDGSKQRRQRTIKKKGHKESHLTDRAKAAKAAGMSYGQYVAMLNMRR